MVGESVRLRGVWKTHPEYGRQFDVRSYTVQLPATVEGMRKYLGSGLIKGIGPVTASRIVDHFGLATLEVIEETPQRLIEVSGMGSVRIDRLRRAWEEQKQIKEIMIFLQSHGVSSGLAVKIFKQYANLSLNVVKNDPYRLAQDIYGIGFKTADRIAAAMGVPHDSPQRIRAGLQYVLGTFSDDGHCYATQTQLLQKSEQLLEVPAQNCQEQLVWLVGQDILNQEDDAIYLPPFRQAEISVARKLHQLQSSSGDRLSQFKGVDWEKAFAWIDKQSSIVLAESQKESIRMALTNRVSVLTGGPGTGKSTIVGSLIHLLEVKGGTVLLSAPTGRAAKRLSETTGREAKTIHRLLEFSPAGGGMQFMRDRENPLDSDLIIVDEASMIDILLMNNLLKAVENGSHLLIVGDVDQLPSVGPGNVLRDLINSKVIPVTRLSTIFRQAADSAIVVNAHRINRGDAPITSREIKDFFVFNEIDPEKAAELVLDLVVKRIPSRFGHDPSSAIQVLSPMHRGPAGVTELNQKLQERLNPAAPGKPQYSHGQRVFRPGDRVMQIRNNYDKKVFNGDLGAVTRLDFEEQLMMVEFDTGSVAYEFSQLDELVHAYAISIHKAQGSEFPVVVIPLLAQHYMMLQRNLLYTGVTRARSMVVLVSNPRAIAIAVHNDRIALRNTRLAQRLQEISKEPSKDSRYSTAG
jgi:exodeoxyribonuclease V alpha subunit